MLVRVCGTVINPDSQSLPFGGELCFHYFIRKRMSFRIVIGTVGLLSLPGALMSTRLRNCLFGVSVITRSRFLLLSEFVESVF